MRMKIVRVQDIIGTEREVTGPGWTSRRMLLKKDGMGFSFHETIIPAGAELNLWYKHHLEAVYCVAGNAINRFQVVLEPEVQLGTGGNDGLMEGEAHAVFFQQHAAPGPARAGDFALGTDNVLHSYNFHSHSSLCDGIAIQYKHAG